MAATEFSRPTSVAPMLATLGQPPGGDDWVGELKWDGVRGVASIASGQLGLFSRREQPIGGNYPELRDLPTLLRGRDAVLDGEIVALDEAGRPRFGRLQSRIQVARPSRVLLEQVPVHFYVFDLLGLDGESTMSLPYLTRRAMLAELDLTGERVVVPPHFHDIAPAALLEVAAEHRLEGIVSKRKDSLYRPGIRSPSWIKTPLRPRTEVIIGGWTPGSGRRAGTFGALLVGAHAEDRQLVWLGNVGTGFTDIMLAQLLQQFAALERTRSPFAGDIPLAFSRDARWVEPVLVADVEYAELTTDMKLRKASFKGLRADKPPENVTVPRAAKRA